MKEFKVTLTLFGFCVEDDIRRWLNTVTINDSHAADNGIYGFDWKIEELKPEKVINTKEQQISNL